MSFNEKISRHVSIRLSPTRQARCAKEITAFVYSPAVSGEMVALPPVKIVTRYPEPVVVKVFLANPDHQGYSRCHESAGKIGRVIL